MTTKYLGTIICGVVVLLIGAVWTLCIWNERRHTKAPEVPPEYYQRDAFGMIGALIVAVAAAMGV